MNDPEFVFRRWLASITALTDIVGARIVKDPLPSLNKLPGTWDCEKTPSVTYFKSGGSNGTDETLPVMEVVMTVNCWGGKEIPGGEDIALRIYRAIAEKVSWVGGDEQYGAGIQMCGFGQLEAEVATQDEKSLLWKVTVDFEFAMDM